MFIENKEIKKIEVPYNFRPTYWRALSLMSKFKEYIKFIYMPCWKEDNIKNTRQYAWGDLWNPQTWDEYVERIRKIESFGVNVCILLQNGSTFQIFKKYYNLGIKNFILGDDNLAKEIKDKHSDVKLNLTITRCLSFEDICTNDYSMYDEIVLFFWANRNLDLVAKLPKKYKYCLQCNAGCYWDCKWHDYHWYNIPAKTSIEAKMLFEKDAYLPCMAYREEDRDMIVVFPEDLPYFDPYINSYKLTDRTADSNLIIDNFLSYILRSSYEINMASFIDYDYYLKNGFARPRDFYNINVEMPLSKDYLEQAKDMKIEQELLEEMKKMARQ